MRLRSNGGKALISHRAQIAGYKPHVWFGQKSITNLIALKDLIKQYCVTYDSLYDIFIVHRKEHGKNNTHFIMHESGLHCYDPEDEDFFWSTQLQATIKVTASDRSRLLKRQVNCMRILVTHHFMTTSGSYRAIK